MRNHRFVDIDEVRNNPTKAWNKSWLSHNSQLTVKDIETLQLPNSIGFWEWISISTSISINEIRNNPNKPWIKTYLSENKQLTVKDIETLQLPSSTSNWDWYLISKNININEVINNPNKPWDKYGLYLNIGITDKILEFFKADLLKSLQKNIPKFKYRTDIVIKYE